MPSDGGAPVSYSRVMAGEAWSDEENDLIVADYFAMLQDDLAARSYSKAEHNRRLQAQIDRGRSSIEFKHQNISAALKGLGEAWIDGYKPAFNFQISLVDAVMRWISAYPDWIARAPVHAALQLTEPSLIWTGPPPSQKNTPPPAELEQMMSIARKFDVAGRDARNRALGRAGEHCILLNERLKLKVAGKDALAYKVRWVSDEDGDGAGYDIHSFGTEGRDRLVEVKTTNGWDRTPFHVSRNELAVADERCDSWHLVRLWDFAREPKAFEIRPPLDAPVALTAMSFMASFR